MSAAHDETAILDRPASQPATVLLEATTQRELARRLDGEVSPQTLQEELLAGGCRAEDAALLVARARRGSRVRTGLKGLLVGSLLVAVAVGLTRWTGGPQAGAVPLVVGSAYAILGLWRLLLAALPQRVPSVRQPSAPEIAGTVEWLSNTLEREGESRCRVLKALGWICVVTLVASPIALLAWMQLRSLRRARRTALDLLQRQPEAVLWCYVQQRSAYGADFAFLVLGVQAEHGDRRLLQLPVPEADADRALDAIRTHAPHAIVGYDAETRRVFRRGAAMRHVS